MTGITGQNETALAFNRSASQYVIMSSSFVDLTYKSFTVEMWFYATSLTSQDFGLFGQCEVYSLDRCLILMIRNYRLLLAFYSGNSLIASKERARDNNLSFRRHPWCDGYLHQSMVSCGVRLRLFIIYSSCLLERNA